MSIRTTAVRALLALGLAGGLAFGAQAAGVHSHDGHTAGLQELRLNQGAKWQTDAPLRQGMDGIRGDVVALLDDIHHDRLPADRYAGLAERLHGHVVFMMENCKLEPAVDEQLHHVLAEIIDGVEAMKGPSGQRAGAVKVVGALEAYGAHFAHPGWVSLKH